MGGGRSSTVVLGVSNVRKSRQLKSDQHPKGCDICIFIYIHDYLETIHTYLSNGNVQLPCSFRAMFHPHLGNLRDRSHS